MNEDLPDLAEIGALPKHAVVGRIPADSSLDDVVSALTDRGIGDDRIHVIQGDEGIAFIGSQGGALGRVIESGERQRYIDELERGSRLIGLFAVPDADQDQTVAAAEEAGVTVLRSFGKWTYS